MAPRQFTPPPHRIPAALLLVALLLLPATSCNNDDDSSDPSPTTLTPESEVEEAYLAFSEMGARLLEAPNPADPEIQQRTTGKAQADLVAGLQGLQDSDRRFELGIGNSHEVLEVSLSGGSHAEATVCVIDDSALVEQATGRVLHEGVTTALWKVSFVRTDGAWLVETLDEGEAKEGAVQCD